MNRTLLHLEDSDPTQKVYVTSHVGERLWSMVTLTPDASDVPDTPPQSRPVEECPRMAFVEQWFFFPIVSPTREFHDIVSCAGSGASNRRVVATRAHPEKLSGVVRMISSSTIGLREVDAMT
jgi:hypothetical protein